MRLKIYSIAISVLTIFLIKINIEYEVVYLSSLGEDGNVAQIYWVREFPYLSVNASIRVLDSKWNVIYDENLILNRDHFGDVINEFNSLSWEGKKIVIGSQGVYYKGPSIISVLEK